MQAGTRVLRLRRSQLRPERLTPWLGRKVHVVLQDSREFSGLLLSVDAQTLRLEDRALQGLAPGQHIHSLPLTDIAELNADQASDW